MKVDQELIKERREDPTKDFSPTEENLVRVLREDADNSGKQFIASYLLALSQDRRR